jgi:hypothetical protein
VGSDPVKEVQRIGREATSAADRGYFGDIIRGYEQAAVEIKDPLALKRNRADQARKDRLSVAAEKKERKRIEDEERQARFRDDLTSSRQAGKSSKVTGDSGRRTGARGAPTLGSNGIDHLGL